MIDVLVIDDEQGIVDLLVEGLRDAFPKAVIVGSTSPEAVLANYVSREIRVVIVDQCMPRLRGPDFIKRFRGEASLHNDALISGNDLEPGDELGKRSPLMTFEKPFKFEHIVEYLRPILSTKVEP